MKVDTEKIQFPMKEQELTLQSLGRRMRPRRSKEAIWFMIHRSKSFKPVERVAKALHVDPKDLIKS